MWVARPRYEGLLPATVRRRPEPLRSIADNRRAPREAAADAFDQYVLAAFDTPVPDGDVERERNRGRRRVAVLANRHDHPLLRKTQLAARALHDADIGLMGNQPVDLFWREIRLGERFDGHFLEHIDGELEHRLTVHVKKGAALDHTAAYIARRAQNIRMTAIGMQRACEHTRLIRGRQDHRARAVAKQYAGGAIVEIENA